MTICQTDSTLTFIYVILSKWVLSITWQAHCKLHKIWFLYKFCGPNEKAAKICCFAPTTPFYIIFTDDLSIWIYPFIIIYFNIIKTFQLINSRNILGQFYAKTAPCFWTNHLLVFLKMRLFSKKCSPDSGLFVASDAILNF